MAKLLRADLTRMFKTKSFWVCAGLAFLISLTNCLSLGATPGWEERTANLILGGTSNAIIFAAIFTALFLGTDYSNGTMRNKLIIGSTRLNVYLSGLLTVAFSGLLIQFAEDIPEIVSAFFGRSFGMSAGEFAFKELIIICATISSSAVFTLLGMIINSKSANTAITITSVFVLLLGAMVIMQMLAAPETISGYEITENGVSQTEPQPNPMYIEPGLKRDILTAVNDVLPTGQLAQIEVDEQHNKELMPLYSLGVLAVTTAAGVAAFRRKDLK